uniref:Endonuclease/exonuclease/phosphatase domain-containing protein n=1 Tax=Glossina austeni TaxID=7395 RepID=A0A1A9V7W5_GLOAU
MVENFMRAMGLYQAKGLTNLRTGNAAMYIRTTYLKLGKTDEVNDKLYVAEAAEITFCSRYEDLENFAGHLIVFKKCVKAILSPVILAGDFSSKLPEWHSEKSDRRGVTVSELIALLDLVV